MSSLAQTDATEDSRRRHCRRHRRRRRRAPAAAWSSASSRSRRLRLLASARSAGKTMKFRGARCRRAGAHRRQSSRAWTSRCSPPAARSPSASHPSAVRRRRRGRRQLLGLPHGPGRAAGRAGDQLRRDSRSTTASSPTRTAWRSSPPRRCGRSTRRTRIKRIIMSTYQAASGAGAAAMEELRESTRAHLEGRAFTAEGAAASLRLQPVLAQHQGRSGDRLQRGRDQGHAGDAQDLRRAGPARHRHLRARAGAARALHRAQHRIRAGRCRSAEVRAILAGAPGVRVVDDTRAQLFPDAEGRERPGRDPRRPHPQGRQRPERAARSRCSSPATSCARARR